MKLSVLVPALLSAFLGQRASADEKGQPKIGINVHPEVGFVLPAPSGSSAQPDSPAFVEAGIGAGYQFTPRWDVDLAVGRDVSGGSRVVTTPNGRGEEVLETGVGTHLRLLGRGRFGGRVVKAVFGAGPAIVTGGNYGTVPLLHLEGGVEFRAASGAFLLLAYQMMEPLASSQPEFEPDRCLTVDCPSRFSPSHPLFGSRLAVGYAF